MLRLAAATLFGFAFMVVGCVDDSSSALGYGTTTLLSVDPATFLGSVRCGAPELRKFVVTVYDVTTGTRGRVATSAATDCTTPASFATPIIIAERFYSADIDGFDRDDVVVGSETDPVSGLPQVVDPATMQPVLPRWTTTCGEAPWQTDATTLADGGTNRLRFPTKTSYSVEVVMHPCLPFRTVDRPDGGSSDGPADATTDRVDKPSDDVSSPAPEPNDAGDAGDAGDAR